MHNSAPESQNMCICTDLHFLLWKDLGNVVTESLISSHLIASPESSSYNLPPPARAELRPPINAFYCVSVMTLNCITQHHTLWVMMILSNANLPWCNIPVNWVHLAGIHGHGHTAPLLHLKQLPSTLLEYLGGTLDTLGGTLEAAGARSSYISRCNAWPATLLGIPQRQQLP